MSAGGSYLNSNVSLISKASIRYEGTLYSINPQEATITLSNVKSYGTEERKVEKYLAPKDTLFEYIIFKANDIQELIVDEPLNDPAIVTATTMPSTSASNAFSGFGENQRSSQSNGLSSDAQATLNGITGNAQPSAASVSSAGQAGDRFKSRGSTPASSQARSPVSELSSSNRQRADLNKVMSRDSNANNGTQQQNNRQNNNNQRRGWDNNRTNSYNNQNNQRRNYNQNNNNQMYRRPGYQNNNYPQNNMNRSQGGYRRNDDRISNHMNNRNGPQFNNRGGHMMRGGGRRFAPQSNNKKFDATLKTEFDFEKANEVFQQMVDKIEDLNLSANGEVGSKDEEDTKTEVSRSEKVDEEGNFYDKTKSFFDKISCEAIERSKGPQKRFDWKQERKLNAETFGLKVTYRPNYHGGFRRPTGYGINRNHNQNRRYNNNVSTTYSQ